MSKTMFIDYRGEGFWAYDVAVGVLLKHLLDRACLRQPSAWLSDCIERWRVNAVISDLGVHLDSEWTDTQRQVVRALIEEACQELQKFEAFSADEAASWKIHYGEGIFSRGQAQIPTAPSIELGRAVSLLLEGALPPAPSGTWWFYGVPDGVTTIQKKVA
jgi:hypothetical protein